MKRRRQQPSHSNPDSTTGSPNPGEPVYLAVGKLRRTHGIEGAIVMEVLTDFPERIKPGKMVYVGDEHEPLVIAGVRGHNKEMIIRFTGFSSPEQASRLRNLGVYVKADALPRLPQGHYYHHQLLNLKVVDEAGQEIGVLDQILETGANDVYLVRTVEGKELLLPVVEDVILEVNLEKGEMRVRPPEWLS